LTGPGPGGDAWSVTLVGAEGEGEDGLEQPVAIARTAVVNPRRRTAAQYGLGCPGIPLNPGGAQGVHCPADGAAQGGVVGLEADGRPLQRLDESVVLLGDRAGVFAGVLCMEALLHGVDEASQLDSVLVPFPGTLDGGGQFVEQAA